MMKNPAAIPASGASQADTAVGSRAIWPARIALAVFCATMALGGIAGRSLTDRDETRVAGIAREMALEGEYALPRLNGEPFLEYPSLGYLPWVAVFRIGAGGSDFTALLPSAIAGLLTVLLTYWMGRSIGGERAGLVSALTLQCTFGFLALHVRALIDPLLLFWISAALWGFLGALMRPRRRGRYLAAFYAGLAAGFLTKGLVGLGIPVAVAFGFALASRRAREIPGLVLHGATALVILPIAAWIWAAGLSGEAAAGAEILRQSVTRFLSSAADHAAPPYFYLDRLGYLLAPAIALLPWLLWDAFAPEERKIVPSRGPFDAFPAVWFLVVLCALSLASAKRNIYIAPIYPAFALWVGTWWARAYKHPPKLRPWRWLAGALPRSAVGRALVLALYALAYLGYACAVEHPRSRVHDTRPLFADAARLRSELDASLVLLRPGESIRGAAVYYLGETVPVAQDASWLDRAERGAGDHLLIGREDAVRPALDAIGARRAEILAQHDFGGEIYAIARVRDRAQGASRVSGP